MATELFTEQIVPEKTRKDLFPDQDPTDPIETPIGAVLVNPRIIGGTIEGIDLNDFDEYLIDGVVVLSVKDSKTGGTESTFVGHYVGPSNNGGNQLVFVGYEAGYSNTTGDGNTFVGHQAGYSNTTGYYNVFVGEDAGYTNIGGFCNVFIGWEAGKLNAGGYCNVFIGDRAGDANSSGFNNIFIGEDAGGGSVTGNNNICLGTSSGVSITSGYNNICIGSNTGLLLGEGFNNVFVGDHSGRALTTGDYNVFIGSDAGRACEAGINNNVIVGNDAGYNLAGDSNVCIGYKAGYGQSAASTGDANIFIGFNAGYRQQDTSNRLLIDNVLRADIATELTNAIIYGVMAAAPANQTLTFNANVILPQDVYFVGSGAGLPFGEIYAHSVAADITSEAQNDWDQITAFDTNGESNNATPDHTNDHITITKAGRYLVSFHWCGHGPAAAHDWDFHIAVNDGENGTIFNNITAHVTSPIAQNDTSVSATGILNLAEDDTIELWVIRTSSGSNIVLTTDNCDITITQIGG